MAAKMEPFIYFHPIGQNSQIIHSWDRKEAGLRILLQSREADFHGASSTGPTNTH